MPALHGLQHQERHERRAPPDAIRQPAIEQRADQRAHDVHEEIARARRHREVELGAQIGREPGDHGIGAAENAGGHDRGRQGPRQMRPGEDLPGCGRLDAVLLVLAVDAGFRHHPPDEEHQKGGNDADGEEHAPADLGRKQRGDHRQKPDGDRIAYSVAALHRCGDAAAQRRPHHFADQDAADRGLAAIAQALHEADHEERVEAGGERGRQGAQRHPQDRQLQDAHAADAIGENAGAPAADRGPDQGSGREIAGFGLGQADGRDQRRNDERVDGRIHRIEPEAREAGPIGSPLNRIELRIPTETHQMTSL